ncbi:hypothetical protein LIT38_17270 [Bacillus sp. CMF12]|uniref:hypothetical protein n=1 Tax=Bacillaceae TaxID=186817 RepID=UPI001FB50BE0|nr:MULTISPECIES: hypothetical protein [Bacillaceae]UOE53846.1 hypothetical protein IRB79_18670 [Cytobacillus oceanisediminis]USK48298.1 hypothetical protein LIT38_17270 [Bacillus sp. CMF12]
MIGLIIAAILFNFIAFTTEKRLTKNQILHIWTFTISAQLVFDVMIEFKYWGYWYFDKEPNWGGLLAHIVLVPPVNMMFLNWYPFRGDLIKRFSYISFWAVAILLYEVIALLPEPWGYFNYGWWRLWHAALLDPMLLLVMVKFYKLITRLEGDLK